MKSKISEEDCFMKIASDSVTLQDGHYYLPLPFREEEVVTPNNCRMAEQRAQHLMNDMINDGHAKKFPRAAFTKRWEKPGVYIPHHGVYRKQKKISYI